jgi:hypothetical protein
MNSIAGGPSEPHHALAAPKTHNHGAAGQHRFEVISSAGFCPKRMFFE